MKYLLVLIVVVIGGWLLLRNRAAPPRPPRERRAERDTMVACAHCGVHLPRSEAVTDGLGRPFCSDEHRLAGPR